MKLTINKITKCPFHFGVTCSCPPKATNDSVCRSHDSDGLPLYPPDDCPILEGAEVVWGEEADHE